MQRHNCFAFAMPCPVVSLRDVPAGAAWQPPRADGEEVAGFFLDSRLRGNDEWGWCENAGSGARLAL